MWILYWNIRGMISKSKQDYVRRGICKAKDNLCFIQEQKLISIIVDIIRKVWGDDNFDFRFSMAEGFFGGVITI